MYNQMVTDTQRAPHLRPLDTALSDADVDRLFHALADTTRRDIVTRVIEREQSVSELAHKYAMSFAAVQKHVALLERCALVSKERRGREQIVRGNLETVRRAIRLLDAYEQVWRQRAERIDGILAADNPKE
jgi:DNA-binding transcriptional ArsR family regulator